MTKSKNKSRKNTVKNTDPEDDYTSKAHGPKGKSGRRETFSGGRSKDRKAHAYTSPANMRRRMSSKNTSSPIEERSDSQMGISPKTEFFNLSRFSGLPLTNRNLHRLLSNTHNGHHSDISSSIALDMDEYARQQREATEAWNNPFADEGRSYHDDESLSSMEFGGSNPSSEDSDGSASPDDVWFQNYYDHDDGAGDKEDQRTWPDLKVLEEFVQEELQEHASRKDVDDESIQEDQGVNFQYPLAVSVESESGSQKEHKQDGAVNTDLEEDSPLLNKAHIDELEVHKQNSYRVRPPQIQPWEQSKERIPTILNNNLNNLRAKSQKPGKLDHAYRYAYFREDLEKTIFSPTISGLIVGDSDDSDKSNSATSRQHSSKNILGALHDLFNPLCYSKSQTPASIASSIKGTNAQFSSGQNMTSLNDEHPLNQGGSNLPTTRLLSPPNRSNADGMAAGITSNSESDLKEKHFTPFWLDVLNPSEEEMKVLSKTFGLHPLTTEDISLGETREKVEVFKSYYFICFTSFDIVYERRRQRAKEHEKMLNKLQEMHESKQNDKGGILRYLNPFKVIQSASKFVSGDSKTHSNISHTQISTKDSSSAKSKGKKIREGELQPLNMYMIVFKEGVLTFHFSPTPHPINVRRRARLLRDYLNVSSDWISYALIDDITDSFAPLIESIETEVNSIEDAILKMHSGDSDSDDDSDSEDGYSSDEEYKNSNHKKDQYVIFRRKRTKSVVDHQPFSQSRRFNLTSGTSRSHLHSSSRSLSLRSTSSKILGWKRKGDMLRRIGECRKRVMSVLRLLVSKADVIKGFSKRFNDQADSGSRNQHFPRLDIAMYLGDIQDHIVTMMQSLNHYERLLARFHSNYLAQINIDMTKVNNDTNDVLGKITILGTIVLPINVVTGLWGMNCVVPGQDYDGLAWFWSIILAMLVFSLFAYHYARKVTGL